MNDDSFCVTRLGQALGFCQQIFGIECSAGLRYQGAYP